MNTQIINTELVLALRKCLRALSPGWPNTRAFALRVLADADARQQEERAVKNIVEAESRNFRLNVRRGGVTFASYSYSDEPLTAVEVARIGKMPNWFPRPFINGVEAKMQAARAVRPGEGYLPAALPAKGCNCDVCTEARLRGLRRAGL